MFGAILLTNITILPHMVPEYHLQSTAEASMRVPGCRAPGRACRTLNVGRFACH